MMRAVSPSPRLAARPRTRAAGIAWAVVFALLFAQWLGQAHSVLHGGHAAHGALHDGLQGGPHAHEDAHEDEAEPASLLEALFGHTDEDGAACRLLDQAAVADLLLAAPASMPPPAPAQAALAALHCSGVSAYTASYHARGPPAAA
jgi:hypothetical protein